LSAAVQPVDALLAVDIGNSRIGLSVWDDDGLGHTRRVVTAQPGTWRPAVEELWEATRGRKRRAVVAASVHPSSNQMFSDLAAEVCKLEPLFVREDLPLPIELAVDRPDEIGLDRVCAAAAAYERIGGACAIASFGTAITIDCVSRAGVLLGGAILPGLALSSEALHRGTELLPQVEPAVPVSPFARNTRQAIVNGIVYGAAGALREIVERFATELHEWPHLVLTGGDAPLIAQIVDFADAHVPDLCLMGVALAYRKAAGQP